MSFPFIEKTVRFEEHLSKCHPGNICLQPYMVAGNLWASASLWSAVPGSLGPTTGELGLLVDNYKISSLIAGWFRRKGTGLDWELVVILKWNLNWKTIWNSSLLPKFYFSMINKPDTQSRIPGPQKINYCNDRESQITYSNLKSCDIHFGIPESHNLMISKARSSISRFKKAGSSSFLEPIATVHHIFGSRYPRDPQWIPHVPFTNGCSELCSKRPAPFANCRLTPNCRISFEKWPRPERASI